MAGNNILLWLITVYCYGCYIYQRCLFLHKLCYSYYTVRAFSQLSQHLLQLRGTCSCTKYPKKSNFTYPPHSRPFLASVKGVSISARHTKMRRRKCTTGTELSCMVDFQCHLPVVQAERYCAERNVILTFRTKL